MVVRGFSLRSRSSIGAIAVGALLLVAVGVVLAFGFVLLLGLAVAGLLLGTVAALLRRLTGKPPRKPPPAVARHGLDPALEVTPPDSSAHRVHPPQTKERLE